MIVLRVHTLVTAAAAAAATTTTTAAFVVLQRSNDYSMNQRRQKNQNKSWDILHRRKTFKQQQKYRNIFAISALQSSFNSDVDTLTTARTRADTTVVDSQLNYQYGNSTYPKKLQTISNDEIDVSSWSNDADDDFCGSMSYNARSMFGTKEYWDDVYVGRGDFPADTYSWYTNWNEIQSYVKRYLPSFSSSRSSSSSSSSSSTIPTTAPRILIPGIGNDDLLIDMIRAGYHQHCTIVVQDYSHFAMERQIDLLLSIGCTNYIYYNRNINVEDSKYNDDSSFGTTTNSMPTNTIELYCCDITKKLPSIWDQSFDLIIEKGLLDAVYLSDDTNTNVQNAIYNMYRVLKNDGIMLSISSVIPKETRQLLFPLLVSASLPPVVVQQLLLTTSKTTTINTRKQQGLQHPPAWEWIRDGSTDQKKAGCFLFQKRKNENNGHNDIKTQHDTII